MRNTNDQCSYVCSFAVGSKVGMTIACPETRLVTIPTGILASRAGTAEFKLLCIRGLTVLLPDMAIRFALAHLTILCLRSMDISNRQLMLLSTTVK